MLVTENCVASYCVKKDSFQIAFHSDHNIRRLKRFKEFLFQISLIRRVAFTVNLGHLFVFIIIILFPRFPLDSPRKRQGHSADY